MPTNLHQLRRQATADLVAAIPEAVARAAAGTEMCALAIVFAASQPYLPPSLALCPSALRESLLAATQEPTWYAWQAAEWYEWSRSHPDQPGVLDVDGYMEGAALERVRELGASIDTLWEDGLEGWDRRVLRDVARELNAGAWPASFVRGDDFVAYAWEVTGDPLLEDLEASIPAERAALFRRRGWLL